MNNVEYAGFWIRVAASLIDTILMMIIVAPIITMVYGLGYWSGESFNTGIWDLIINYILPAVAVILFWIYKSATPGKMAFKLTIVDANTGGKPSTGQLVGRYFAYYLSMLPIFMGFIWVGIDKKKQGWHDKIAGTVVIRNTAQEPVQFNA
ncbi:MAG: putative RDD family membrane protein YckC [Paraglaciecola sp.]|jgi:uncharacterized RDD family membrane protein YckC